jgi:hypothetical protein
MILVILLHCVRDFNVAIVISTPVGIPEDEDDD